MREMFIEKGFNDFLSKPIDVSKMDEILIRWIPKEKREEGNGEWGVGSRDRNSKYSDASGLLSDSPNSDPHSPLSIPGIDTEKGIAMTGGALSSYKQVLSLFRKDARDRLPLLKTMPDENALPAFITQVHALKSASASLGAAEISAQAAELEAAGKAKDMALIQKNLSYFAARLSELINHISDALDADTVAAAVSTGKDSSAELSADISSCIPLLQELVVALREQKADDIDHILDSLMQETLDKKTKEILDQISDEVLMAEYDKAGETVQSLLKGEKNVN
jgi:HPt (histidine-containing phosphotransfer) domain-containing protein